MDNVNNYKELIILSVLDCMKIEWHCIYISKHATGNSIHNYFKNYYNKNLDIELDVEGLKYNLKTLNKIDNFIITEPDRMCLYINFN